MAGQRSAHVPKFGNFDGDQNVQYTAHFDSARKEKGGGAPVRMNPNDPQENPAAFMLSGSFNNGSNSSNNRSPAPSNRKRSDKSNSSTDDYSYGRGTTSVPKFGDWDVNAGYTVIFNNIKEEKQSASSVLPDVPQQSEFVNEPREKYRNRRNRSPSKMRCCFF